MMTWPMPVAMAAPEIPISGRKPIPKISSGSKMILEIHPHSILIMAIFILPTDWKIFSKESPTMMIGENRKAMAE